LHYAAKGQGKREYHPVKEKKGEIAKGVESDLCPAPEKEEGFPSLLREKGGGMLEWMRA